MWTREGRVTYTEWTRSPCFTPSQKYGTCRAEEVTFYRRWLVAVQRAHNAPPPTTQTLDMLSPAVGCVFPILVGTETLCVQLVLATKQPIDAFVLSAVDSMLDIVRHFPHHGCAEEQRWVTTIERLLARQQRSEFVAVLRARWTAAPFQAMLRARGFSHAQATMEQHVERSSARRDADIAAHGLHPCGLPSCDQHEVTVKQFKYCGDCEEEWYCCAEHQVLHWKEHKPICRARTAAASLAAVTLH